MRPPRRLSFSALLTPAGIHVVGYRRSATSLAIHSYARDLGPRPERGEAARALAELLGACGARGRRVALSVSGYGVCHQILSLPPADPEVLRPVVAREMRRFFPDLFADAADPIVDFAPLSPAAPEDAGPREVLAAAVPRSLVATVRSALSERGIELDHWTILPRAVQRLHESYVGGEATCATLLLLHGAPVVAFFHAGAMRLFSEPSSGPAEAGAGPEAVAEQLRRGTLYLRQQYRGARPESLVLAAEARDADVAAGIAERHELPVAPLGPLHANPGALAALAAALDASEPDALDLLPPDLRPPTRAERSARGLVRASVALVAAAAAYWSWSAARQADGAAARVEALRTELAPRVEAFATRRPLVSERQEHAARVRLLSDLVTANRRLPEALWPLQAAAPEIALERLEVREAEGGWRVEVGGTASAATDAGATDAVDALVQQLSAQLPRGGGVSLDGLEFAPADADTLQRTGVTAGFRLTFLVPEREEGG